MLYTLAIPSPVQTLNLIASDTHLVAITWENETDSRLRLPEFQPASNHAVLNETKAQLDAYFAGKLENFTVPIAFVTGTPFQQSVWNELAKIPYGETRSYADIANTIGNPKAVRAVGMANHCNPVSIILPCHRVVGKNGSLTGYAGGLPIKAYLLELESKQLKLAA